MTFKILILDDKAPSEDFSTIKAISQLTEECKDLIDLYDNTKSLWLEISNGDDIELITDFSNYPFIFIHDSFDNPLVRDGLKPVIFEKLSKTSQVVLFSGSKKESESPVKRTYDNTISKHTACFEIVRRQYFNNLRNFIDSYLFAGTYQIKYLYNPYITPRKDKAYRLLEFLRSDLEESLESAIKSSSFTELLLLCGYHNTLEIANKFSIMTDDEFIECLENLIEST